MTGDTRVFLFLQGPHGPFLHRLGHMIRAAGAKVWRVGFNAGDRAFWWHGKSYIPFRGTIEAWPETLEQIIEDKGITDIVLYGDTRPVHAAAVRIARDRGLSVHIFEEGYMRPYWVTYERGGSNGNSSLMGMSIAQMQTALDRSDLEAPLPPARWGDMLHHMLYGALYHGCVLCLNWSYRNLRSHREMPVSTEFRLYLTRLLLMPFQFVDRVVSTLRIRRGGWPYHVVLLQLEHDSAFQMHSPFRSMPDFLAEVMEGFASGAPYHHHLVIKSHPLEDGRTPLRRVVRRLARHHGIARRVHFVGGGKLARLLDNARTAVTVNSTAGQQVLWRGIPLRIFGKAVYDKPELVSDQPLRHFFGAPTRPDSRAYKTYRRYLLETSQVPGGFYSARARRQLLRHVVDMMLASQDPYDAFLSGTAAPRQQLRVVS